MTQPVTEPPERPEPDPELPEPKQVIGEDDPEQFAGEDQPDFWEV